MDDKQDFNLEDILKEFGDASGEEKREETPEESQVSVAVPAFEGETPVFAEPVPMEQTRRMDPVAEEAAQEVTGDTIRLDGLRSKLTEKKEAPAEVESEEERIWNPGQTIHAEAFSENWEPEYDQPMGTYVPPKPLSFQPRSRLKELKRKLIEGPEKRYYEMAEQGMGKLQVGIFLSLLVVLIAAASTVMYALGMVQENRLRLMVFSQFFVMLLSALLGCNLLMDGVADLLKKRFTLHTFLVIAFLVCCVDGMLCLGQVRVPCCAAFSLSMLMALWGDYQRRSKKMSQLDTLRKAVRLDGIAACGDYMDGKKGLLRKDGEVEDFMDNYETVGRPEKTLNVYSFIVILLALALGIAAGILTGLDGGVVGGITSGVQVAAVSMLAGVPATALICQSRPALVLQRKFHKLGTVLCGWQGVEGLSGKLVFPITYGDLYPGGTVRLNGVKYFGNREPEQIAAYAAAVIAGDKGGLSGLFTQVLDAYNGRYFDACDLQHYDNGGMQGTVEGERVLIGSSSFMKEMGVEIPENAKLSYAVYVAIETELSGLFAVSYEKSQSVTAGLTTLNSYSGLQTALVSDDFMLTPAFIRSKFGIKSKRLVFPDYDTRSQLRQKELDPDAPCLIMTTALGLAPVAYGVTGARVLRTTCRMGTVLHIVGGAIGLCIMGLLVALGALHLLTPANMFLYQLVWMIPAILVTEWTNSI